MKFVSKSEPKLLIQPNTQDIASCEYMLQANDGCISRTVQKYSVGVDFHDNQSQSQEDAELLKTLLEGIDESTPAYSRRLRMVNRARAELGIKSGFWAPRARLSNCMAAPNVRLP